MVYPPVATARFPAGEGRAALPVLSELVLAQAHRRGGAAFTDLALPLVVAGDGPTPAA